MELRLYSSSCPLTQKSAQSVPERSVTSHEQKNVIRLKVISSAWAVKTEMWGICTGLFRCSLRTFNFEKNLLGRNITVQKKGEIGRKCSTHSRDNNCIQNWREGDGDHRDLHYLCLCLNHFFHLGLLFCPEDENTPSILHLRSTVYIATHPRKSSW
jgi:hypothetical protein